MSVEALCHISKPHLVDLLRVFDRHKWLSPRIRYASVRSKPELIGDICREFCIEKIKKQIRFCPKRARNLPTIVYDLEKKHFLFDSKVLNVGRISREKPGFQIRRGPIELSFDCYR